MKLLRVLQERTFRRLGATSDLDFHGRIVCATNRDLEEAVRDGVFREDLLFRLNVVTLRLPPLRERPADVISLCEFFVKKYSAANGIDEKPISAEAKRRLIAHRWPGNVRELENAIERASILTDGDVITPAVLDLDSDSADEYIPETLVEGNNEQTPARDVDSSNDLSLEDYFQHFVLENQDRMSETELAQKLGEEAQEAGRRYAQLRDELPDLPPRHPLQVPI